MGCADTHLRQAQQVQVIIFHLRTPALHRRHPIEEASGGILAHFSLLRKESAIRCGVPWQNGALPARQSHQKGTQGGSGRCTAAPGEGRALGEER